MRRRIKAGALLLLAAFFCGAGVNHFLDPAFYVAMMPPYVPAHEAIVVVTGVLELLGGIAILLPRPRPIVGWALIAFLVAVFPANLQMALHPEQFPDFSVAGLYARLPLQLVLIAWTYWATRPDDEPLQQPEP